MASLLGAITFLTLAGSPGLAPWSQVVEEGSGSRPDDGTFTQLQPMGGAGARYGSFTDKTEETYTTKVVTDTYVPVITFANITDYDIDVTDTYVPVLRFSGVAGLSRDVSDTYSIRTTFALSSLVVTGDTPKTVSDTYKPVLTLSSAIRVPIAGTDTYIPVLSMSGSKLASAATNGTDTYVPVLTFTRQVTIQAAQVARTASDTYTVRVTFTSGIKSAGEVDRIRIESRPMGYIRITKA